MGNKVSLRVFSVKVVFLLLLTYPNIVTATVTHRRAVIDHDAVVGFDQTVPDTSIGELYLTYKPYLNVVSGCVPFPAVDAAGNTNGGLSPTGSPSGDCDSSDGQVYARSEQYGENFAIMYAWYFPKDEPSDGLGHRHDWESVVVWIDDPDAPEPAILGVAASAHGDYSTTTSPNLSGTRPLIRYFNTWPLDHQLGFTSTQGGEQPLIAWQSMTDAARSALENTDFGSANVPFKDANFENNLAEASL
ncbi:necrosis inducing protein-domain-containing protein [Lineolata rhizophorae]|uniref:Necrosis inducing protein-domain-containing protein n=1 Tax=Lineolata rhizophorae TaxID=578093 RepID=A0A6A6NS78_9PEZI|nr:necrosis inducing protein-domain-containing protein [Lineolata rhizophorae]